MRLRLVLFAGLFFCPAIVLAQRISAAKPTPTGTVSGHVFYADTNGPARLATVLMEAAAAIDGYQPGAGDKANTHVSGVTTLPDGSFAIPHVAPGVYYVFAAAPGYVSPIDGLSLSRDELQKPDKAVKERIAAAVPRVVVQANLAAAIDVTLERGAAVAGTVLYDDGSPAAGLRVLLLVRADNKAGDKAGKWVVPESGPVPGVSGVLTDDRGSYRISGLPAREYLAEVELKLEKNSIEISNNGWSMNGTGGVTVPVYSGNSLREKDAVPFRMKLGEERPGEDLLIPLNKLHAVTGVITAARDGHVVNGGTVQLLYADDKTEAAKMNLAKDDTSFSLNFVPEGDYIARVTDAADLEYTEVPNGVGVVPPTRTETHAVHHYATGEQPLHVQGDVTGLAVAVPEKAPQAVQASALEGH